MSDPIPGIVWPPLNGHVGDMLATLRATETLTRTEIKTGQLNQLRSLAAHARAQTAWGRRHLPEELTWESFRALPVLDRAFVQSHEQELHAARWPAQHGTAHEVVTSGSTGTPVRVLKSFLIGSLWQSVTARDHVWHRRDLALKLGAIRAAPWAPYPGLHDKTWGGPAEMLGGTGPSCILSIDTPPQRQLDWLDEQGDVAYLVTFPSNLAELLRLCEQRGSGLPALRAIRTVSEPVTDELRARCRNILGVDIVDQYSTQEVGYIALQRPDGPGLYVMADTHVVEILDDAGSPCAPGEIGRVVVTPLHNFCMPLFRYAVGDLALVGKPGPLPYPVIERVFGRTRNLLLTPDGTRRWVFLSTKRLMEVAPLIQLQLVQTALDRVDVRLVVERAVSDDEEQDMRAHLGPLFEAGTEFTFSYVDHIPRGPGGKFEDFICAVPD
ncbi:MAG: hypothetical protein U0R81_03530 [Mycobacterium sp.]